ncbi:hypothetical protein JAAARDRAFT_35021 [Jaapia argillacea MUCL 33604]|uniref:GmrSD restriction endonucleases N-terminal domain-containing protein n=1 Tax=Jaapia argillacea MUCL 33604 TaxID=933084 RepID=A0A067Q3X6_9AGAM|nr:hypothetical protein JAAARDRAFT_35021 [Jaapia argillacea MUCL 33604]
MDDDDYESDLTEIDDDEDDYKAAPRQKKKADRKSGFVIHNALKVPRATTYTAQSLYDQIHSSDIDLDPEYQRDVVWPENKQIGLIDSVFRNFYIPPVIFVVRTEEDGSEHRTCIDGKQRLTSIYRFMDGLIPHKDPTCSEKLWFKDLGTKGVRRTILPEKYRRLFANKQIVCVEYQDITQDDEREIFQRVQLGMALTPAEKLQAISSPRAALVRDLQNAYLGEDGLVGATLDWSITRGSDFRCLAQFLQSLENFPDQKTVATVQQLDKWLHSSEPPSEEFCEKAHSTYSIFLDLAKDKKHTKVLKSPAKVAPLEFVMISLLIAVYKDKLSLGQLAGLIEDMRKDVRSLHKDIRLNNRVARSMMDFIRAVKPTKVKSDGGEPAGKKGKTGKRKRSSAEEEEGSGRGKLKNKVKESPVVSPKDSAPPTPKIAGQTNGKAVGSQSKKDSMPPPQSPAVPGQVPTPTVASSNTQKSTAAPPPSGPPPVPANRLAAILAAKANVSNSTSPSAASTPAIPQMGPPSRPQTASLPGTPIFPPPPGAQPPPRVDSLEASLMRKMSIDTASSGPPAYPNGNGVTHPPLPREGPDRIPIPLSAVKTEPTSGRDAVWNFGSRDRDERDRERDRSARRPLSPDRERDYVGGRRDSRDYSDRGWEGRDTRNRSPVRTGGDYLDRDRDRGYAGTRRSRRH